MASQSLCTQDEAEDLSLRAQLLQKQCQVLQLQALEHARHSLETKQRSLVVPDLPAEVMRDFELAISSLKTGLDAAASQQRGASPPPPTGDMEKEGRRSDLPTASACSTRPPTAGTHRVSSCWSPPQSRPQSAVGVSSCWSPAQSRPQSAVGVSSCCSPAQSRPQSAVVAARSRPQSATDAVRPSSGSRRARPRSAAEQRSARSDRMTGAPTFEELDPKSAARLRQLDNGFILKDLRARLKEDRESREKRLYMLTSRPDLVMVEHSPFFQDERLGRSPTLLERVEASEQPGRKTFRHRLAKYTNTALARWLQFAGKVAKVFADAAPCRP